MVNWDTNEEAKVCSKNNHHIVIHLFVVFDGVDVLHYFEETEDIPSAYTRTVFQVTDVEETFCDYNLE